MGADHDNDVRDSMTNFEVWTAATMVAGMCVRIGLSGHHRRMGKSYLEPEDGAIVDEIAFSVQGRTASYGSGSMTEMIQGCMKPLTCPQMLETVCKSKHGGASV